MAYIDVVTLAEAKTFLRVDDGFTADDTLITLLINVAGEYIERYTNHMLYSRNKDYVVFDGEKRVYDTPITAVVDPASEDDYEVAQYETYRVYSVSQDTITLTVGYDVADVPSGLKLEMLNLINDLYHGNEDVDNGDAIDKRLSKYKRHII